MLQALQNHANIYIGRQSEILPKVAKVVIRGAFETDSHHERIQDVLHFECFDKAF